MNSFSILLPNEKGKTYRYITLFVLLINCVGFGLVFFKEKEGTMKDPALFAVIISSVGLLLFLINFFSGRLSSYRPGITLIILSPFWFILGNPIFGVLMVLIAIASFFSARKLLVNISMENIRYPSFPRKTFSWDEVSNVVLKDNILTIDLKNNKLIQSEIARESAGQIDEQQFNEFCRMHLKNNR